MKLLKKVARFEVGQEVGVSKTLSQRFNFRMKVKIVKSGKLAKRKVFTHELLTAVGIHAMYRR